MYYNYTDEEKHFLSITDAMLKDDFSVEEIVEFWQSEDQDQIDGIMGSLTLTESVDYSNPDLAVVCERFGMGWISRGIRRLTQGLRGINPKTGNPRITGNKGPTKVQQATSAVKTKVKQGASKVKAGFNKLPTGAKGGLALAGGSLALIGAKDIIDTAKDAMSGGNNNDDDKKGNNPTNGNRPQPGDEYSTVTKTTPVSGPKGRAWWQSYEKAAPYHSSKRYHDNIRGK